MKCDKNVTYGLKPGWMWKNLPNNKECPKYKQVHFHRTSFSTTLFPSIAELSWCFLSRSENPQFQLQWPQMVLQKCPSNLSALCSSCYCRVYIYIYWYIQLKDSQSFKSVIIRSFLSMVTDSFNSDIWNYSLMYYNDCISNQDFFCTFIDSDINITIPSSVKTWNFEISGSVEK